MKKLSLKQDAFSKGEVLTRTQLKKVMGGTGSSCPSGQFPCTCTSNSGTVVKCAASVADCWNAC